MKDVDALKDVDAFFWLVWQPGASVPTRRHASLQIAGAEAQRLAEANPAKEYYILPAIGRCVSSTVTWETPNPTELAF